MKLYTLKAVTDFLESGLAASFKVTKVEKVGFNERVGNIYHVNTKLETTEDYRNKFVTFEINSSYLDEDEIDDDETLEEYIESLLFSYYMLG